MSEERRRRLERVFHAALEREPEFRLAFLNSECDGDAELRHKVELLLEAEDKVGSFLEPLAVYAPAISEIRAEIPPGTQFGPYRIIGLLGAGGMGEVYRAHDSKLGRDVAIKTLPPEFARDSERLARFRHEARMLASLNHPHIAAIYGLEDSGDADCLVLELVDGETLRGPLPMERALDYGAQIAEALEAAHAKGIIHRDLKPANVKVTSEGRVKVLDFGLAKAISGRGPDHTTSSQATSVVTADSVVGGHIVGTPGYMSPEQASGKEVDKRTDVWAFGCLLYEMLAGRPAFRGDTPSHALAAVLQDEPEWRALPAETPANIARLLRECLAKDVNRRLSNIREARNIIEEQRHRRLRWRSKIRDLRFAIPAILCILLIGFGSVSVYRYNARVRWAREQAVPEIRRLFDSGEREAALRLLRHAEKASPDDPNLKRIEEDQSMSASFSTDPQGADVWAAGSHPEDDDWFYLGRTPFTTNRLSYGYYRLRIAKPGFRTILGAAEIPASSIKFELDAPGSIPQDMLRVPGATVTIPGLGERKVGTFLIDRCEVTNRQFRDFVAHGGYSKPEYWKEEFVLDGRKLSWEDAIRVFRDSTGRPGPSTWEQGEYPQGHEDYPVSGVSWYEAAAYAEFVQKQLPTIYHWQEAARPGYTADIAQLSNFSAVGPVRVGSYRGIAAFGTLDMAGNVREWCWNSTGAQRYIRGGAWNEPAYMFSVPDARSPSDRSAENGFRCIRYDPRANPASREPVTKSMRDYATENPVPDQTFRLYQSLYSYDSVPLEPRVEEIDKENSSWRREKVSFAAGYGHERAGGYLYVPKNGSPPYQTIMYAPTVMALWFAAPGPLEEYFFEFVIKSGRAVFVPVVKGQYRRRYTSLPSGPNDERDRMILESKDFRRSIDYLVSRTDVDRNRLGVYGFSRGCSLVPILATGELRLKAAALVQCGLWYEHPLPEADVFNFVPHFRVPSLMVNGRLDSVNPLEASVRPMFRLLGAPEKNKKMVLRDEGHFVHSWGAIYKEVLDWYDTYLGPVK